MEARILTLSEMPEAVKLAQGVFNFCLRQTTPPQCVPFFEQYVNEANIRTLMEQESLTLWGIYEQGILVAMSGMQSEGHITMLYVLPVYQRRGYGRNLLAAMRRYAGDTYQLKNVTVNAMPSWTASYFKRRGFRMTNPQQAQMLSFLPMQAKSLVEIRYEKKEIPTGAAIATALGGLGICMLTGILFMVQYLL